MPTVLIATDADWIRDEMEAALGGPDTTIRRVRAGAHVQRALQAERYDLVVLDLQIGNMGGMATAMDIRLEEGSGRLDGHHPILMLLDREADTFLAGRCDVEGWLVKPLDAFRLRRAATALLAGGTWYDAAALLPR